MAQIVHVLAMWAEVRRRVIARRSSVPSRALRGMCFILPAFLLSCGPLYGSGHRAQLASESGSGLCTKGSDGKPTGPAHDRARITQLETYIEGKPGMVKIALDRAVKRNAWEQAKKNAPAPTDRSPKVLVSVPYALEACFQDLEASLIGTELRVSFTSICRTRNPIVLSVRFALYNERGRVGLFDSAAAFAVTLRTASILSDMAEVEQATTGVQVCYTSDCALQAEPSLSFHLERLLPVEVLRNIVAIEVTLEHI